MVLILTLMNKRNYYIMKNQCFVNKFILRALFLQLSVFTMFFFMVAFSANVIYGFRKISRTDEKTSSIKVIDMTGKEERILKGYQVLQFHI